MNTTCLHVIIHEHALRANLRLLRSRIGEFFPVIKADAYGHGCLAAAGVIRSEGIRRMAVGTVGEAALLRRQGHQAELLALLGVLGTRDAELAARYRITVLVHNLESLTTLAEVTTAAAPLPVAIKLDTGMARLGFAPEEAPALVRLFAATPQVRPSLVVSHLAAADCPELDPCTREQHERFSKAVAVLRAAWPRLRTSLGNSPGSLGCPDLAGDLPRPGVAIYGINPFAGTSREALGQGLLPVMEVTAPVLDVHALDPGQALGYGCSFTATRPMRVAVIGAGYADGVLRALSNGGIKTPETPAGDDSAVLLHGQRAPIRGRICMQMTLVDVTHIPETRTGDTAHLLGGEGPAAIAAQDLARWAGTIPYEIVCALGKNPREVIEG